MHQPMIINEIQKTRMTIDAVLNDAPLLRAVEEAGEACVKALKAGRKIMFCGNGGSAADAQHLSAELVSRLNFDRPGLSAIALTTDTSALTAIGNDYGYEQVFARQVEAIGQEGDVLISISTSGNSANVLKALYAARTKNIVTIGLAGRTGGKMNEWCDIMLRMPSMETPKIQECHIMLGHILCAIIENTLFASTYGKQKETA